MPKPLFNRGCMDSVDIHFGYIPGAIGTVVMLHAHYYHRNWQFGLFFERKVAGDMVEFTGRFDDSRDGLWLALDAARAVIGAVAIDGREADDRGAHLRWFIVAPEFQGRGIGRRLLTRAMTFCRECAYRRVYLWTFAGLEAARHLYETQGFHLCREFDNNQWGVTVREQEFEWTDNQTETAP